MKNLTFSIVIPCRDEETCVRIIAKEIIKKCRYKSYEIVFVNDYSKDKTLKVLKNLSKRSQKIKFFNNRKKGLGGAIDLGIRKSRGKFVCIFMADSSDSVGDLNKYFRIISTQNVDAVFGSRFVKGSKIVNYPILKMILNRLGNILAQILFLTRLNDFTNGFKIYKKDVLDNLYPLVSESFNIFIELPLKVITRGHSYKIIPISYTNRTVGLAKFKINELGSKYIFTLLYCFLEKILINTRIK